MKTMVILVVVAAAVVDHLHRLDPLNCPNELFSVKDSKGRTRLAAQENGDAFALYLYDEKGRRRIIMQTGEEGRPTIATLDASGEPCGLLKQEKDGSWMMGVSAPGGPGVRLTSAASKDAAMAVHNMHGKIVGLLGTSVAKGETLLTVAAPSTPETNLVRAWSRDSASGGIAVESGGKATLGMGQIGDTGLIWLGDDARDGSYDGRGVRIGYTPKRGASLVLRHSLDSGSVLLQDYLELGKGMLLSGKEKAAIQVGISAEGMPSLKIVDPGGAVIMETPQK